MSRWRGPGNAEFRRNVEKAFREKSSVRLIVSRTEDTDYVEAGGDASKVKKDFHLRDDLIGEIVEYDGENYVFRFVSDPAKA
ncbi:MAG: hypothetical protein ABL891_16355 [Burkholderiales bacterium]